MRRFAFLLIDQFALLSTASALEPLRAANLFLGEPGYEIHLLSRDGGTVSSSGCAQFDTRSIRDTPADFDLVFVIAGGDPSQINDADLFAWLRRADRAGCAIGGISGGSVPLARAGLLDGRRFTVHWHHYELIEELAGDWLLERRLFVIDRDRYTCAGGSAPLDMMHAVIARDHGTRFAQRVSDWFIQTEVRGSDAPQRASIAARYGVLPEPVEAALDLMDSHIADPLDQTQIAQLVGLSARQLQRRFRETLGRSVMQEYRRLRLDLGRDLIENTGLPLSQVAQLSGFASQSHFTDAFRAEYGRAPSRYRANSRTT